MGHLYNRIISLRSRFSYLIGLCALLATLTTHAQSILYVDGAATFDNQQFESLNRAYQVLTAVAPGATPPPGTTYEWLKNEQPQGSTASYCYVTGAGVYRLRFNGTQLSNCIIVNIGAVSGTRNYAITDQARNQGIKETEDLNLAYGLVKQVTYQDGFGRPLQQIAVNAAAGTGQDFVQPYAYGPQGEQTKSYLPFASGYNGDFKTNWQSEQNAFYQWVSPKVGRPGTNGPTYSEVVADNDPLGRVMEKASPGESWKLNGGHTKQLSQRSNTSGDNVRLWTYTPAAALGTTGTLVWTTTAAPANTLATVEAKDEDDNWSIVFTNERGETVCRRTYLSGTPATAGATYLETAYAYDAGGHQLAFIPPKAVQELLNNTATASGSFLDQYLFITHFDALGRAIAHKVPGKGWAYTVYDRWDRVAATQNVNQNSQGVWAFNKYDVLNRVIMTGEVVDSRDPAALATALQSWPIDQRSEQRANTETGYTLTQTFPTNTSADDVATVDYYDDYEHFPISSGQRPDLGFVAERGHSAASTQTRGLRTGGRQRTLSGTYYDQWLTSVAYYDQYGRVVQELKDNSSGKARSAIFAVDRVTRECLFTGEVAVTFLTHHRYNQTTRTLETHTTDTQNTYDGNGHLSEVYESIDGAPYVLLEALEYNELGQVVDKKLGYDYAHYNYIQSLDYRYNIRGWLTNINNRNLSNNEWLDLGTPNSDTEPDDAFGLELKYEGGSTTAACYNGNISGAIWNTTTSPRMRQYGYTYDGANRIKTAQYSALNYANGQYTFTAEKDDANLEGRYTTSGLNYDPNGNIKALNRSGLVSRTASGTQVFGHIDELTFDHDGNRLRTVTDAIPASAATNDFENGPTAGARYIYDDNGNLTRDPNKKVSIYYNQLNLPYYFSFDNGNIIYTLYTTTGEKTSSTYYAYSSTTGYTTRTVQYIEGFTYSTSSPGTQLELTVNTPTGRAIFERTATASSPAAWAHEYHIRDHQGSLRLVLKQEPVLSYRLGLEAANASEEEAQFQRVAETRQLDATHARTGTYSARLNAYQADRANGPATVLRMAAGDSISLEVFGLYDKAVMGPRLSKAIVPLLAIGGSTGAVPATGPDGQPRTQQRLLPTITAGVAVAWAGLRGLFAKPQPAPQASFTYELYNQDSVLVRSATCLLTETGQPDWQQLQHSFRAKEAGYVKVYLANASGTNAWFDDLQARIFPVPTKQVNHYDPWGQNLEEIETTSGTDSKEQYTGKERITDFGLEWTDYGARNYDSQLGRWHSPDPVQQSAAPYAAMGNNPMNNIDPDGRFFAPVVQMVIQSIIDAATTAAVIDITIQGIKGGPLVKINWGEVAGAAAAGATTGGLGLATPNKFLLGGNLARKYVGKALYAGLVAETASVSAQATSDLVNNGEIGNVGTYLKDGLLTAAIAIGVSGLTSAYSYATWDKYNVPQRARMMNDETGLAATHDTALDAPGENDMVTSGSELNGERSTNATYSNRAFETKGFAIANYAHEMQHRSDILKYGLDRPTSFYESRGYSISQQIATNGFVPSRYQIGWGWHNVNNNGVRGDGVIGTITPFNILANLFR